MCVCVCVCASLQLRDRKDCKVSLSASYLEIYNEAVFDLLTARMTGGTVTGGLVGGRPVLASKDLGIKWDPAHVSVGPVGTHTHAHTHAHTHISGQRPGTYRHTNALATCRAEVAYYDQCVCVCVCACVCVYTGFLRTRSQGGTV